MIRSRITPAILIFHGPGLLRLRLLRNCHCERSVAVSVHGGDCFSRSAPSQWQFPRVRRALALWSYSQWQ